MSPDRNDLLLRGDELEAAERLIQDPMVRALLGGLGASVNVIDAFASCYEFVQRYGIKIDRRPYDWTPNGYAHLRELYEDDHPAQVAMAGAQTGKTGFELVHLTRSAALHNGAIFGYFFPDLHLPSVYSEKRFAPMIRGNPTLKPWLGASIQGEKGTDRILSRSFAQATILFLTIGGRTSTEGTPMKGVYFDEVRRMTYHQIQLAEERTSGQIDPVNVKVSTALYPESDIHLYFLGGDQRYFHTACACSEGAVLSLLQRDAIMDLRGVSPAVLRKVEHAYATAGIPYLNLLGRQAEEYGATPAAYRCPKCDTILVNPREGWWEPHEPRNAQGVAKFVHSWQMPQALSPTYPASRVLAKLDKPTEPVSKQEIANSVWGLPYLDPERQPVQLAHLLACVNPELVWPATQTRAWRREHTSNTALGMDAQAGYNCVVIKERAPNGKHRTIHVEVAHDRGPHGDATGYNPWERVARLMHEFDVRVAVIDCMPHWNEAHRFALAHEGRVFLATYDTETTGPMVTWGDTGKKPGQKGEETRFRYTLRINKVKGLDWSLGRWAQRTNETPPPGDLVQRLPVQGGRVALSSGLAVGQWELVAICREVYWLHQQRVAFRDVYEDDDSPSALDAKRQGKKKIVAEHVGLDPHFAHANLYCDVALARIAAPRRSE